MNEQQLINYLYWLKDRGQAYPSLAQTAAPSELQTSTETTPESLPPTLQGIRLLFISQDSLIAAEGEMVARIAAALGLSADHFRIITPSDLKLFDPNFIVALGQVPEDVISTLQISHPRDMLRDPKLKVTAWEKLLTLKSALH